MGLLKPIAAIAALALAFLYIVGESTSSEDDGAAEKPKPDIEFTVTKDESDQYKRQIEVLLTERISESELKDVAEYLYQARSGNTFIGYNIQGEGDYGYWATTHYNPDLGVRIIGSSQDQQQELSAEPDKQDGLVIGRWQVSRGYNSVITILDNGDGKRIIQKFQDGSQMDNPVHEREVGGETRLMDGIGESNGEYYIIGDDGRLQFWSDSGNYYTAPIDD